MPEPTPVPKAAGCTGAGDCFASIHTHGCYADFGDCDSPEEHTPVPDAAELAKKLEEIRGDAELLASAIAGEARWQSLKRLSDQLDLTIHEAITLAASPDASLSPAPGGRLSAAGELRQQRLAEWDEGRVWLDGAWFEVTHYGTAWGSDEVDATLRRLSASPAPLPDDEER